MSHKEQKGVFGGTQVLAYIVFVCKNLFSAVLLRHMFFWLTMLYHSQGIGEQLPEK